mmetsp:Transcript_70436/g.199741  ORF Transcript_70436/g.199741 Transcript_70436/m.199741 type:complete len:245 (-) Transcript_70436:860-1594(-)
MHLLRRAVSQGLATWSPPALPRPRRDVEYVRHGHCHAGHRRLRHDLQPRDERQVQSGDADDPADGPVPAHRPADPRHPRVHLPGDEADDQRHLRPPEDALLRHRHPAPHRLHPGHLPGAGAGRRLGRRLGRPHDHRPGAALRLGPEVDVHGLPLPPDRRLHDHRRHTHLHAPERVDRLDLRRDLQHLLRPDALRPRQPHHCAGRGRHAQRGQEGRVQEQPQVGAEVENRAAAPQAGALLRIRTA